MTIISYIIIGAGVVALWHFIYEAILLPSQRVNARFKFFALRDRLRTFKTDNPKQCDDETFKLLDESLSWEMDNLAKLNYSFLRDALRRLQTDAAFKAKVDRSVAIIERCKLQEYTAILAERNALVADMFVVNAGGWFLYLFPVAIVWAMGQETLRQAKRLKFAQMLGGFSTVDLERMAPKVA